MALCVWRSVSGSSRHHQRERDDIGEGRVGPEGEGWQVEETGSYTLTYLKETGNPLSHTLSHTQRERESEREREREREREGERWRDRKRCGCCVEERGGAHTSNKKHIC
jgi:hypothetical protein